MALSLAGVQLFVVLLKQKKPIDEILRNQENMIYTKNLPDMLDLPSSFSAYIFLSVCIKTRVVAGSNRRGDHIDPPLYFSFAILMSENFKFVGTLIE